MLALIVFFTDKEDLTTVKSDIFTFIICAEAVKDSIWEEM